MQDKYNARIGLITDGEKRGTRLVDTETEKVREDFPPLSASLYCFKKGVSCLKLEIPAAPAIIEGIVRRVDWTRGRGDLLIIGGHTPYPEHNPMGRKLRMECDGTFAGLKPLDDETRYVFEKMPFTNMFWEYRDGECSIVLTCLVQPVPAIAKLDVRKMDTGELVERLRAEGEAKNGMA